MNTRTLRVFSGTSFAVAVIAQSPAMAALASSSWRRPGG